MLLINLDLINSISKEIKRSVKKKICLTKQNSSTVNLFQITLVHFHFFERLYNFRVQRSLRSGLPEVFQLHPLHDDQLRLHRLNFLDLRILQKLHVYRCSIHEPNPEPETRYNKKCLNVLDLRENYRYHPLLIHACFFAFFERFYRRYSDPG